jgi:hypothetical protein
VLYFVFVTKICSISSLRDDRIIGRMIRSIGMIDDGSKEILSSLMDDRRAIVLSSVVDRMVDTKEIDG